MRPRDIRRQRRAARIEAVLRMRPLFIVSPVDLAGPTAAQLVAAEALREEFDLLCRGAPSDAELWRVMEAAR